MRDPIIYPGTDVALTKDQRSEVDHVTWYAANGLDLEKSARWRPW